ncbi:MAG: FtsX-like permease family protein [Clostridiales bacterium]|jgi:putative ABC transport system permease protein|nr:FtsX-like permease family protein [Clostridiales bacterium]
MADYDYDAIVVGAGPGGTTAVALLAHGGMRVLLADKNPKPGGRMTTVSIIIAVDIAVVTGIGSVPLQIRDALDCSFGLRPDQIFVINELADKIELIGYFIPTFFILVSALTALATMSRLVNEERGTFACYKTLGCPNGAIACRYVVFAFAYTLIGCVSGLALGNFVLRPAIFGAGTSRYELPDIDGIYLSQGLIWSVVMSAAVLLTALFISLHGCKEKPADLLRPKAPKAGKKFFLEGVTFIRKRLKFKYKSAARNIWRFKGRLIMTVLSAAGAVVMLFLELGLLASVNNTGGVDDMAAFTGSIKAIAVILVLCAVALCVFVLFNLTNINIEERKREIATLKVLGYNQIEVAGFIYREPAVLSVIGIIAGLPFGYVLLGFLFDYLGFGSLGSVEGYVWISAAAIAVAAVFAADALLYRKIIKIEMCASLKTAE